MLILTRMPGEQIRIGDDVVITVMWAGEVQVSLGIEAPRSVPVVREELLATALESTDDKGQLQAAERDLRRLRARIHLTGLETCAAAREAKVDQPDQT